MNSVLNSTVIENPSLWRLSMMVSHRGLDVWAVREVGEPQAVSVCLGADPAASDRASLIEEIIYSNPLLLKQFRKLDIVFDGGFTLVVPAGTSLEDIDAVFPDDEKNITLSTPIDSRNSLVFRIDRQTYNFFRRTFDYVSPTHSLAVLAKYFAHRSRLGNSGKLYLDLSEDSMNVLVFNHLGLSMASCFECKDINDAAYYALASAKTVSLDMKNDEIRVAGNPDRRARIMPLLRRFANNVMPAIFPASSVCNESSAQNAPFPLIVLPLCE